MNASELANAGVSFRRLNHDKRILTVYLNSEEIGLVRPAGDGWEYIARGLPEVKGLRRARTAAMTALYLGVVAARAISRPCSCGLVCQKHPPRPYNYKEAVTLWAGIVDHLYILSGDKAGGGSGSWQETAAMLAVELRTLAARVEAACDGRVVDGPVVFPSPDGEDA
jgi:hypothetical protein